MKKVILLTLITLALQEIAFAQHKKRLRKSNPTEKDYALAKKRSDCYYNAAYTTNQRRTFYPFKIAQKVQLIGFTITRSEIPGETDTAAYFARNKPIYNKASNGYYELNKNRLREIITLSEPAVDSLTDILYNYGYTPLKTSVTLLNDPNACYEPHNAILFLDNEGRIKEFMEFCFICDRNRWSSLKMKKVVFCNYKYDMIRKFFIDHGINFGTNEKY